MLSWTKRQASKSFSPKQAYLEAADGDEDVLLGDLEDGADLGLEVGLKAVLPEASLP